MKGFLAPGDTQHNYQLPRKEKSRSYALWTCPLITAPFIAGTHEAATSISHVLSKAPAPDDIVLNFVAELLNPNGIKEALHRSQILRALLSSLFALVCRLVDLLRLYTFLSRYSFNSSYNAYLSTRCSRADRNICGSSSYSFGSGT